MTVVYIAEVADRFMGTYAFGSPRDAERFAAAVRYSGGDCDVTTLAVCDHHTTDSLVAAELDGEA